jgi:multiple sugar transport system permease protein
MTTITKHKQAARDSSARLGAPRLAVGITIAFLFLFPVAWTVLRSLQSGEAASVGLGPGMFQGLSGDNYAALGDSGVSLVRYATNSAAVALGTTALTCVVATLAGYALARIRFAGAGLLFVLILTPFMVPFQGILVPLFTLLNWMGLSDDLAGLVLVYTTFQLPFAVFVMRNSFAAVPKELEEAAMIDGLNTFTILVRALLPIVTPGIATVALYAFIFAWNEFLAALILMTSQSKFTLPVALVNIQSGQFGTIDFGVLSAGATVATIPCLLAFLLLQRYYVSGLAAGSTKG